MKKKHEELLFDMPDYEQYTENEVILTKEESAELGLLSFGGCCNNKGKCGGCHNKSKEESGLRFNNDGLGCGTQCNCKKKCCEK